MELGQRGHNKDGNACATARNMRRFCRSDEVSAVGIGHSGRTLDSLDSGPTVVDTPAAQSVDTCICSRKSD